MYFSNMVHTRPKFTNTTTSSPTRSQQTSVLRRTCTSACDPCTIKIIYGYQPMYIFKKPKTDHGAGIAMGALAVLPSNKCDAHETFRDWPILPYKYKNKSAVRPAALRRRGSCAVAHAGATRLFSLKKPQGAHQHAVYMRSSLWVSLPPTSCAQPVAAAGWGLRQWTTTTQWMTTRPGRFFSIHFVLPFAIGVVILHLALLHKDGSNNPLGVDSGVDKVPFYPYFIAAAGWRALPRSPPAVT
jgi:hypothetical protein